MPWRVWRRFPKDPNDRHKRFVILAAIAMIGLAGLVWWIVGGLGTTQKDVAENQQKLEHVPTKAEVYQALVEIRKVQRNACRVVNGRFRALADLIGQQRPSPTTTAYYRDHPEELAKAQSYFDDTLRVLQPRNCSKQYPVPDPTSFGLPATGRTRSPGRAKPPASSRPHSNGQRPSRTTPNGPGRTTPRKPSPPSFSPSRPRQPGSQQQPAPTATTPTPMPVPQPSPNLPTPTQPVPPVIKPVCDLAPTLPTCR